MIDAFLVPENTVITAKGDGPAVDVSAAESRILLVALTITRVVEQESLDLSILGSKDGASFGPKALATFPQKFYAGQHPLLLDLSQQPDVKFLRAHWEVNRWGRGSETPMFELGVALKEVPREVLQETGSHLGR